MMAEIKIHVFHTGEVCVAPDLPFGGEHCSTIKASGAFAKKSERLWLPVSAYYASKEFVRSFSEAVAEEVRSTGVTVTALCPGPTATGFEQAAQMKNSHMFSMFKPASAAAVAEAGFRAAQKGKTLRYCGWPTHTVSIAARLLPRSVCRRFMMKVNG